MNRFILIISFWLFLSIPNLVLASYPFVPRSGKTLLLVGQDRDTIAHYVRGTGDVPGGTMLYTSIQSMDGLNGPADYGSGQQNGRALLRSYPNSVIQLGLYMVHGLEGTIDGNYDANLKTLAKWIKNAKRPVYLRIGYEFDSPANYYSPSFFIKAFRYVVDYLRKAQVDNVVFIWHSYCTQNSQHWMDWFPGDDYVDWFGATLFSTNQIPMVSDFLKLAREHKKPFMICESTLWGLYTIRAKIDWFKHVFQFIEEDQVEAFCYIDSDWDNQPMWAGWKIGDARIEVNNELKRLWLNEIDQDRYLKASADLF